MATGAEQLDRFAGVEIAVSVMEHKPAFGKRIFGAKTRQETTIVIENNEANQNASFELSTFLVPQGNRRGKNVQTKLLIDADGQQYQFTRVLGSRYVDVVKMIDDEEGQFLGKVTLADVRFHFGIPNLLQITPLPLDGGEYGFAPHMNLSPTRVIALTNISKITAKTTE